MALQKSHEEVKNSQSKRDIILVAENLRTPENVGMVLRVAEAFGIKKVYFTGTYSIQLTTKVKRASRNTYQLTDHSFNENTLEVLEDLKKLQYDLVALEITNKSIPIRDFLFENYSRLAIVIGSERNGISEDSLSVISDAVHIPLYGENSSINVVNALSIALYEIVK